VLILVLALLSILLILATTLSFTSRLEMAATENFARGVQGRFAAIGGLAVASAIFDADPEVTHNLERWAHMTSPPAWAAFPANARGRNQPEPGVVSAGSLGVTSSGAQLLDAVRSGVGRDLERSARAADIDSIGSRPQASAAQRHESRRGQTAFDPTHPSEGMAQLRIEDESSRIDVNAIRVFSVSEGSQTPVAGVNVDFSAFLRALLEERALPTSSADSLARAIALHHLGPDGQPGESGVDDDGDSAESLLDRNFIDDDGDGVIDNEGESRLGVSRNGLDDNADGEIDDEKEGLEHDGLDNDGDGVVDEILEGVDEPDEVQSDPRLPPRGDDTHTERLSDLLQVPGVTPEVFAILAPYLTTHSASVTVAPNGDDLVDINRADYDEILAQLEEHFDSLPRDLLVQFALNIVDARDPDSVPSQPTDSDSALPLLGLEMTPLINEVWPDSETGPGDGDDGQYVEILNPWPRAINLAGYTLRVGDQVVALNGELPPNGMLIVTDDFDESEDDDPETEFAEHGCFLDIFGLAPNGTTRQLIVDSSLELPDTAGTAELRNREGDLLDWFRWRTPQSAAGRRISFQRDDPRVRASELRLCTPFEANRNMNPPEEFTATYRGVLPLNRLFSNPGDLMFVFAGWAEADPGRRGWTYPAIASEPDQPSLDSRLIDIFSVMALEPTERTEETDGEAPMLAVTSGREHVIGRININTASRPVLRALPGVDATLAQRIVDWRAEVEAIWSTEPAPRAAPFGSRGDLLRNEEVWSGISPRDRLDRFGRMANAVTTSSATCRVWARAANDGKSRTPTTSPRQVVATFDLSSGDPTLVSVEFPRYGAWD
jgi:type II secretory pathway component PulK